MSSDQHKFIKNVPDYMKDPAMIVTVLDGNQKKLCEYKALPGLDFEKYVCGEQVYTKTRRSGDKSLTVYVHSNRSHQVVQIHIGVYQW